MQSLDLQLVDRNKKIECFSFVYEKKKTSNSCLSDNQMEVIDTACIFFQF